MPAYTAMLALSTVNQLKREKLINLHRRLGHISMAKLRHVLAHASIDGLKPKDVALFTPCNHCAAGRAKKLPHPKKASRKATYFGQHLNADCTGTQAVKTPGGATVGLVVIDRFSNWVFAFPVKSKMDSAGCLEYVIKQECNGKTEVLKTDQGTEFVNYKLGGILKGCNTLHNTSNAGDSPQNGAAERSIGVMWENIRVVLIASRMPACMWGEALNYVVFVYNNSPCFANPDMKSPFEMRYGIIPPQFGRMHAFGELGYVLPTPSEKKGRHKVQPRAFAAMLVGFEDALGTKG